MLKLLMNTKVYLFIGLMHRLLRLIKESRDDNLILLKIRVLINKNYKIFLLL